MLAIFAAASLLIQLYGVVKNEPSWKKLLGYLSQHDERMDLGYFPDIDIMTRVRVCLCCYTIGLLIPVCGFLMSGSVSSDITQVTLRILQLLILVQSLLMTTIIFTLCDILKRRYDQLTNTIIGNPNTWRRFDQVRFRNERVKCTFVRKIGKEDVWE
ncbi:hypothetical protein JTB14_000021 [Gonioctena quinquepunctata]|nr:hypothetical protein JTB14_000021 [Gonioctena quinquepunctata]